MSEEDQRALGSTHGEALAETVFAADDAADGHANVLVDNLAVALGGVIIAEDSHWPYDLDALLLRVDNDERVTLVRRGVRGISYSEDDMDLVPRVASA